MKRKEAPTPDPPQGQDHGRDQDQDQTQDLSESPDQVGRSHVTDDAAGPVREVASVAVTHATGQAHGINTVATEGVEITGQKQGHDPEAQDQGRGHTVGSAVRINRLAAVEESAVQTKPSR